MSGQFQIDGYPEHLAGEGADSSALAEALGAITRAAHQVITGVDHASVSVVVAAGQFDTLAETDPVVRESDSLQYAYGEGPCVLAANTGDDVVALDVAADRRWPRYAPEAARLGIGAQAALPLLLRSRRTWGALNLYSMTPGSLDEVSVETARLLASTAAVILGLTRHVESLTVALESRTTIGQAIGLTMAHQHMDQSHAFAYLVRTSQNSNVKLREVARRIVAAAN
jgi:GAF domain-containing protein